MKKHIITDMGIGFLFLSAVLALSQLAHIHLTQHINIPFTEISLCMGAITATFISGVGTYVWFRVRASERRTKLKLIDDTKSAELKGVITTLSKSCHELNQPAQAIMSTVQLAMLDVDTTQESRENRQKVMLDSVDRLGNVTRNMLDTLQVKLREQKEHEEVISDV